MRASKIAEFSVIEAHLSSVLQRTHDKLNGSRCRCDRQRPQFRNEPQDVVEENFRNGDLGHLESDITPVAHDFRADLDELLLEARQRPILDRLRRRQRAQEIAQIVGQRMQLKTDRVRGDHLIAPLPSLIH
jgi:hypothetical protein